MNSGIWCLIVILFIGTISATAVSNWNDPEILQSINEYIDEVMVNARVLLSINNSIPLPDASVPLEILGTLNLTDGGLFGLNTIHRIDDCFIRVEPNGDAVIRVAIGFNEAAIGYWLKLAILNQEPTLDFRLLGSLAKMDLTLQIRISSQFKITVEELILDEIGRIEVKFYDGAFGEVIDVVVSVLVSTIGNSAKEPLFEFVSGLLKDLINDALKPVPVPPQIK